MKIAKELLIKHPCRVFLAGLPVAWLFGLMMVVCCPADQHEAQNRGNDGQ